MDIDQSTVALLTNTFFRNNSARVEAAKKRGIDFVHYTTADTLSCILKSRSVYLRNTRVLNDYSEIKFGYAFLDTCAHSPAGDALFAALMAIDSSLSREILLKDYFWQKRLPSIAENTFVFSMSEYANEPHSESGVLSMWRAYGGNAGVAIVIDAQKTAFVESNAAGVLTFPVQYVDCTQSWSFPENNWLCLEFQHIAEQLSTHRDVFRNIEKQIVVSWLMEMFYLAILRSKHAAFKEECEWRVVRTRGSSSTTKARQPIVVTIGGIPQKIVELHLKKYSDGEGTQLDLEIGNILKSLLIGPCEHAEVIKDAFIAKLGDIGVTDPTSKVIVTEIPYRPNQR